MDAERSQQDLYNTIHSPTFIIWLEDRKEVKEYDLNSKGLKNDWDITHGYMYLELAQCGQLKSASAVQFHYPKSVQNRNNRKLEN